MNQVHTGVDIAARRVARSIAVVVLLTLNLSSPGFAQDSPAAAEEAIDTRTQYPVLLRNSYFSINLGYIDYAFTNLANQSNPLFTHIFSLKFNLKKKEK